MPTVMIIAKDHIIAERAAVSLEHAGMEIATADCVTSGLEIALETNADLMLCEEALDDMTAIDLLEIKRAEPRLADVPVIVCASSPKRTLEHFEAGADEFILLPFNLDELPHRVRAVLRRSGSKGVSGSFSHLTILEVIQMLVNAGRNGRLDVNCRNVNGRLWFRQGQVFNAECDELLGEEAFLHLLREAQQGGEFSFVADTPDEGIETNIDKRTDHLLLGLANILDEES